MSDLGQWLILIFVMVVPTVLVALAPRRWLWRLIVGWLLLPVVVFAVFAVIELLVPRGALSSPGTIVSIVVNVGSIVALPWLAISGLGFAFGAALRSKQSPRVPMPAPAKEILPVEEPPPIAEPAVITEESPIDSEPPHDSTIRVDFETDESGKTLRVRSPRIVDLARDRTILDLWGTDWDATASYPGPRTVALELKRVQHGGSVSVTLDLEGDRYSIVRGERGGAAPSEGPLTEALDAITRVARKRAARVADASRSSPSTPVPFVTRRTVLILLAAGAALAIAVLALFVLRRAEQPAPPPPPPINTVPTPLVLPNTE